MDGWLKAQVNPNPREAPLGITRNIGIAKKAMQIEELVGLIELIPAAVVPRPKRRVLDITDGLSTRSLDGLNRRRSEMEWLVEPNHVRAELPHSAQ
jgi:hypothetical protein